MGYSNMIVKGVVSLITIAFFGVILCGIIKDANAATFGGPILELITLFSVWLLLAANEGFQVAVLQLESLDTTLFVKATMTKKLLFGDGEIGLVNCHQNFSTRKENKIKKLLIGQSFLVVFSTFIIGN